MFWCSLDYIGINDLIRYTTLSMNIISRLKSFLPFIKATIVAVILLGLANIGLDIPRSTVEEVVDGQFTTAAESNENKEESFEADAEGNRVVFIVDGDTLVVETPAGEEKIRLIGIDTPETANSPQGEECYGAEASAFARGLLTGKKVVLSLDETQGERDRYERLLAYVEMDDGRDIGEVLIREGYAFEYTYNKPYKNQVLYQAAEAAAKKSEAGLWKECSGI